MKIEKIKFEIFRPIFFSKKRLSIVIIIVLIRNNPTENWINYRFT